MMTMQLARRLRRIREHIAGVPPQRWLLSASGWVTLGLVQLPPGSPVRMAAVFLFVLVCPGLALSALITRDRLERFVLTMAISISLALLLVTAMTLLRNGDMSLRIAVLALITTAGALMCPVQPQPQRISSHDAEIQP